MTVGPEAQASWKDEALDFVLADLAYVLRERPVTNRVFWDDVSGESVLACRARLVDCNGWVTFESDAMIAAATYRGDAGLRDTIPFEDAWDALRIIVNELDARGVLPLRFPL